MKSRTSIRILKVLLGSIFSVLIVNNVVVYFTCHRVLSTNKPIVYTIKESEVHNGRGSTYTMTVIYQAAEHEVEITSETYAEIAKQKFPLLFYNPVLGFVFEKWKLLQAKRLVVVGSIMLLVVLLFIKSQQLNAARS